MCQVYLLECNNDQVMFDCGVPRKIHTLPTEGHWKFLGRRDIKSQNFRSQV